MTLTMRQKSNWLFAQIILLTSILLGITLSLFYKIYDFVFGFVNEIALSKVRAACGCQIASGSSSPIFTGFILLLGAAIITTIIIAVAKVTISLIKTKKFISAQQHAIIKNSKKLSQIAGSIGIEHVLVEINTNLPIIFCHGIKNSKIYISSKVVQTLNSAELRAVLLHETHHLLVKEPARLLLIKFLHTFNFIPGIKNLTKKYLSLSEIAADELATDNFKEKNHLAAAMAKMLEMEEKNIIQKELALSFFSQITEERILTLSDKNYQPTVAKEVIKTIFGLVCAGVLFFLFSANINNHQANAQTAYTASGCADKIIMVERCENGWTKCANNIYHQEKINCAASLRYLR